MAGTAGAADHLALADGFSRHRHGEKRALEGNFRGPLSKTYPHFCERSCCGLGCQRGDRAHRATHKSPRSAGSQMSKDEANAMSDKPAAIEPDRGLWGAPE